MNFKRLLIKLSGEHFAENSGSGVCFSKVKHITDSLESLVDHGIQITVVVGGGNIMRGAKCKNMNRVYSDYVGMLATTINSVILRENLRDAVVMCSKKIYGIEEFVLDKAIRYLSAGKIVICAGGTGVPFFTTDTASILRACELQCDLVIKCSTIDGVYSDDPKINPNSVKLSRVSYDDIIANNLRIMDLTAIIMAKENNIPIIISSYVDDFLSIIKNPENYSIIN